MFHLLKLFVGVKKDNILLFFFIMRMSQNLSIFTTFSCFFIEMMIIFFSYVADLGEWLANTLRKVDGNSSFFLLQKHQTFYITIHNDGYYSHPKGKHQKNNKTNLFHAGIFTRWKRARNESKANSEFFLMWQKIDDQTCEDIKGRRSKNVTNLLFFSIWKLNTELRETYIYLKLKISFQKSKTWPTLKHFPLQFLLSSKYRKWL